MKKYVNIQMNSGKVNRKELGLDSVDKEIAGVVVVLIAWLIAWLVAIVGLAVAVVVRVREI